MVTMAMNELNAFKRTSLFPVSGFCFAGLQSAGPLQLRDQAGAGEMFGDDGPGVFQS